MCVRRYAARLVPLSVLLAERCAPLPSVVAYSVVMGALMASGKEVVGRIPKGKVPCFTTV